MKREGFCTAGGCTKPTLTLLGMIWRIIFATAVILFLLVGKKELFSWLHFVQPHNLIVF